VTTLNKYGCLATDRHPGIDNVLFFVFPVANGKQDGDYLGLICISFLCREQGTMLKWAM